MELSTLLLWTPGFALALGLFWAILNPVERWRTRTIPGPAGLPLVGHLLAFALGDATDFTVSTMTRYGNVVRIWFGNRPWITISDPGLIRKIGFRYISRPARMTDFGHVLVGHNAEVDNAGAFVASGEVWRRGRRAFEASIIHSTNLNGHLPAINRCAERFVARLARRTAALAAAADGPAGQPGALEMLSEAGTFTMASVGEVAYGIDFGTLEDDKAGSGASSELGAQLVDACRAVFRYLQVENASVYLPLQVIFPGLRPLIRWLATYLPDPAQTQNMRARSKVAAISKQLMEQWQANKAAADDKSSGAAAAVSAAGGAFKEVGGGISSSSFMHAMMEGRRGAAKEERLSDVEVIGQSFTFIIAGFETTADTLAMTTLLLATHPDVQARLAAEIDAVVGNRELTPELLAELPYTDAVLQESMRLYPPAPYLLREANEDVDLGEGRVAPKGSVLVLHVHSMHHDPDVWPQPEAFLPQRFLPEGKAAFGSSEPHAWATFGVGARMCVGYKLALQVAKVALVRVYGRFRVSLHPKQPLPIRMKTGLSRVPADGVFVTLQERAGGGGNGAPAAE